MSNAYSKDVKRFNLHKEWKDRTKEAYLYTKLENNKVQCGLCPRGCVIPENGVGFCKVRKNLEGTLYAQSYGKATHVTVERIETEALFHYSPGAKILSLGNFGCNLDCDYCQNWKYSQFQYTSPEHIHEYTSQDVIQMALDNNVDILSWTYNDPAVWFEFVIDTAKEAKKYGIRSLFKSAFFLSKDAVEQLCEVMDVFAISIKAIDEKYYHKFTKGWLQPVLDNTKLVHGKGIHFEISNLVVTGLTNTTKDYDKMIDFVLNDLSPDIPVHFTRFHPDYKYMQYDKTPIEDVVAARNRALERGLNYAYIGNAFEGDSLNSYCPECNETLIERYGLHTFIKDSLHESGTCAKCGYQTTIKHIDKSINQEIWAEEEEKNYEKI
ncbi:AmmeMemoRadiSam system radical SAM enzyme [Bacillus sp. FJAT-27264]|uniref:AmmeMemoRadiSam system radical SAM enzyme n=1 Tax=Paenibacillus sp. (strain DSM 101736 / FJAT-27264) TaxID=1850362 RepID=UPI000807C916|nr:AmmeMemoRadiSam system radical SAM enzyme [Bacillus sp. FJAT-27264]OBZ14237.1 AmmeMemoRadiSam system radical SAM enzyme [Bacillus sp. FJAT-27264]